MCIRARVDATVVYGVNHGVLKAADTVISNASCTTNCLAPLVKPLHDRIGVVNGLMTTIHAYTNTQSLTDQPMKDRREPWAAAENIIPSASGAARALQCIWRDLKITGKAYRVPVRTGSIAELIR